MILRRLAEAIRQQNWFTVVLEILIVVIGIFFGLQVNDWNQQRKDRTLEQKYLVRLSQDIRSDIAEFENLASIFETKAVVIREIRDLSPAEVVALHAERLAVEIDGTTWKALPRIQLATYRELEATGRLVILSDPVLRAALSDYYVGYQLMQDILAEPLGDYRLMFHQSLPGEKYFDMRLTESLEGSDWLIGALETLKSRPGFVDAANAEIGYAANLIYYLRKYGDLAHSILSQLNKGLTAEQNQ